MPLATSPSTWSSPPRVRRICKMSVRQQGDVVAIVRRALAQVERDESGGEVDHPACTEQSAQLSDCTAAWSAPSRIGSALVPGVTQKPGTDAPRRAEAGVRLKLSENSVPTAAAVHASGAPASGVPASGVPASGVPASGVPASGVPRPAFLRRASLRRASLRPASLRASGVPASGVPASGVPASGAARRPAFPRPAFRRRCLRPIPSTRKSSKETRRCPSTCRRSPRRRSRTPTRRSRSASRSRSRTRRAGPVPLPDALSPMVAQLPRSAIPLATSPSTVVVAAVVPPDLQPAVREQGDVVPVARRALAQVERHHARREVHHLRLHRAVRAARATGPRPDPRRRDRTRRAFPASSRSRRSPASSRPDPRCG